MSINTNYKEAGDLIRICSTLLVEAESPERKAEIRNIMTPVCLLINKDGEELNRVVKEMNSRIEFLIKNPDSAGNHDQFKTKKP